MAEIRDITKLKQSLRVAELYFQDNLSQIEISDKVGVSRPTVSRLLQYAKDNGLVKIEIVNPLVDSQVLAQQLTEKYGAEFHVVPNNYAGVTNPQDSVGKYTADFISTIVEPGDIIGIGWGSTIHSVTKQLEEQDVSGIRVVQLKGSISHSQEKRGLMKASMSWRKPITPVPNIYRCRLFLTIRSLRTWLKVTAISNIFWTWGDRPTWRCLPLGPSGVKH